MSVVLADLPGEAELAVGSVKATSPRPDGIIAAPTDVADPKQVQALRDRVIDRFGKVNVLANNAVTRVGRGLDADLAEWRKAMDINLWGPILGVRAFLPVMLASGERGAIINAGSKQGITNPPGHPIYNMTKSALKTYTELLEHELRWNPGRSGRPALTAPLAHSRLDDHWNADAQARRVVCRSRSSTRCCRELHAAISTSSAPTAK